MKVAVEFKFTERALEKYLRHEWSLFSNEIEIFLFKWKSMESFL